MFRLALKISAFVLLLSGTEAAAQTTRNVLFLGNSYTGANNLPQLIKDAALSAGDTLIFDRNTPGGQTLEGHATNTTSQNKIMAGGWDYVVLQGQSQEPVVQTAVFNQGAFELNEMINEHNPCAVPMLYMTWGRKNGDASTCDFFPEMCTYESMDDALKEAYLNLATWINAEVSPVSVVWRNLRENHPDIELYTGDGSHPSAAGSYAAACSFYAAIFKRDPTLITYDFSLNADDVVTIRNAAKTEVFDSLEVWDFKQLPQSGFHYSIGSGTNEVFFSLQNPNIVQTYSWNFGDGNTSELAAPTHSYASNGTYTVTLTTTNCDLEGLHTSVTDTIIQFCDHTPTVSAAPDSLLCESDTLWTQPADSYQWYSGGLPIPVTTQYLANYQQYLTLGFSVMTTVDGCAELSVVENVNPEWSGYYFDSAMGGDPCEGDTAIFTVHHIDGLSGAEIIRWYKNDTLLPSVNDEDTLFITEAGIYTVHVINPESDCPLDTTSASTEFICETVSVERHSEVTGKVYPNPASSLITVEFPESIGLEEILIYGSTGRFFKATVSTSPAIIDVGDLPAGLYFIRLRNHPQAVMRFVKE